MSLLATVPTNLGPITLHRTDEGYETRRYLITTDEEDYVSVIPLSEENAREWYELARRRGGVKRPFPGTKDTSRRKRAAERTPR